MVAKPMEFRIEIEFYDWSTGFSLMKIPINSLGGPASFLYTETSYQMHDGVKSGRPSHSNVDESNMDYKKYVARS